MDRQIEREGEGERETREKERRVGWKRRKNRNKEHVGER